MFAEGFKCETQVIAFVLSADTNNDPDVLGINGASAALTLSDIPFLGPIGAVRVGQIDGKFIINPTYDEMRESLLNIMVVGTARFYCDDRVGREGSQRRDRRRRD